MAFAMVGRTAGRTSKELLERCIGVINNAATEIQMSGVNVSDRSFCTTENYKRFLSENKEAYALKQMTRSYAKKFSSPSSKEEKDSDSDSDDEFEKKRRVLKANKPCERGESQFWRRKMRTFHRILDINRDGVVSFDDFNLLAKRFTDLGHLTPEMQTELMTELKAMWEETFGEITQYNLKTAEQFLVDFQHRLNDKSMVKRMTKFLPYLFKAVDYDHNGHLNLEQYKLFFKCLGLSDEDAAISFAVIDQNGDGQISLEEFVHLGAEFFLTENTKNISKMFWGPLIDH